MIRVEVQLIGYLAVQAGTSQCGLDFEEPPTVDELLGRLTLHPASPRMVTRQGRALLGTDRVVDGDRLAVAPLYSGG